MSHIQENDYGPAYSTVQGVSARGSHVTTKALLTTLAAEMEHPFEHDQEMTVGITPDLAKALASRLELLEADYERFQRSTEKELKDRDSYLIELQQKFGALREKLDLVISKFDHTNPEKTISALREVVASIPE